MFASAHLTSGVAVGLAAGLHGMPLALFVGASVLTDWDYALQLPTRRNHRSFLSHCPPFMGALVALVAWRWPMLWPVFFGMMLHYALDPWDYGLRLNPFSPRVVGFHLLPGVEDERFPVYLRRYFASRPFLVAEALFAVAAVALVLTRPLR